MWPPNTTNLNFESFVFPSSWPTSWDRATANNDLVNVFNTSIGSARFVINLLRRAQVDGVSEFVKDSWSAELAKSASLFTSCLRLPAPLYLPRFERTLSYDPDINLVYNGGGGGSSINNDIVTHANGANSKSAGSGPNTTVIAIVVIIIIIVLVTAVLCFALLRRKKTQKEAFAQVFKDFGFRLRTKILNPYLRRSQESSNINEIPVCRHRRRRLASLDKQTRCRVATAQHRTLTRHHEQPPSFRRRCSMHTHHQSLQMLGRR